MGSSCIAVADFCAVRVSRLTSGGAPMTGASNGYVTHEAQSAQITFETEDGRDEVLRNGCNEIVATLRDPDQIKGVGIDMVLCHLDAYLGHILTGDDVFTAGGNAIGGRLAAVGVDPSPVCVETWSKARAASGPYVAPFTTPDATYIHMVFPFGRFVRSDTNLQSNFLTFPVTGVIEENDALTANGPFDDWPSEIAGQGGCPRLWNWFYDDTLPSATCDYVSVTSTAS